jgi:transposase-like protein
VLSVSMSEDALKAALETGRLACPGCSGPLSPWGSARAREVRMLHGVRSVRPRRACCYRCGSTHVLSPAWSVPRRRDGAEVIGEALVAGARGDGHRTIARRLGRTPGTVRGWLRAARRRAEPLRCSGVRWAYTLDPELGAITPAGSPLGDAVEALALAARASVLRLAPGGCPWEVATWLTGGLLHGQPRDPP